MEIYDFLRISMDFHDRAGGTPPFWNALFLKVEQKFPSSRPLFGPRGWSIRHDQGQFFVRFCSKKQNSQELAHLEQRGATVGSFKRKPRLKKVRFLTLNWGSVTEVKRSQRTPLPRRNRLCRAGASPPHSNITCNLRLNHIAAQETPATGSIVCSLT